MIQHFIITRFSYRGTKLSIKKGQDPLAEKNLNHRFSIFEIGCLPSVLNQTNQNFIWILIVDPQLPPLYRERLQKLISKKPDAFLVNFSQGINIYGLSWLKPWIKKNTDFVNTIKLDDDDLLFDGYIQYLVDYFAEKKSLEPITFIACGKEMNWDFFSSKKAPYGFLKTIPDFRFPPSAGTAVCCKYPEINFSIECFEHTVFNWLSEEIKGFERLSPQFQRQVGLRRKMIYDALQNTKLPWEGRLMEKHFHSISTVHPQVITTNHFDNIQFMRVFTGETRIPVNPEIFVPGFSVDFEHVKNLKLLHKKSLWVLFMLIRKNFLFTPNRMRNEGFFSRMIDLGKRLRNLVAGFLKV